MNERIKELISQSKRLPYEHNVSLESFAELIVKECISQIEKQGNGLTSTEWDEGYRAGLNASRNATKQHFGVEE